MMRGGPQGDEGQGRVGLREGTLIADRSPVRRRRASHTVPKPPVPSGSTSAYSLIETPCLGGLCFAGGANGSWSESKSQHAPILFEARRDACAASEATAMCSNGEAEGAALGESFGARR